MLLLFEFQTNRFICKLCSLHCFYICYCSDLEYRNIKLRTYTFAERPVSQKLEADPLDDYYCSMDNVDWIVLLTRSFGQQMDNGLDQFWLNGICKFVVSYPSVLERNNLLCTVNLSHVLTTWLVYNCILTMLLVMLILLNQYISLGCRSSLKYMLITHP